MDTVSVQLGFQANLEERINEEIIRLKYVFVFVFQVITTEKVQALQESRTEWPDLY